MFLQKTKHGEKRIRNQLNKAAVLFQDQICKGLLLIIGATYDFTPEGKGELRIIQVNDQTDERFINAFIEDVQKYGDNSIDPGRPFKQGRPLWR